MSMRFDETDIPGCYHVHLSASADARGIFVKVVHASTFFSRGLESEFKETFYTVSGENVLRGMHVQLPPAGHSKMIYCLSGSVMDVFVDLRIGSPAFGRFDVVELTASNRSAIYLPPGVAHGFHVREAPALMMYHVTSEHTPSLDAGIHWNSFGAPWPASSPLLSPRDAALPPLRDFRSPFQFVESGNPPLPGGGPAETPRIA